MAIAIGAVVTVSMLAETIGMASSMPRVKLERVATCRRERTRERRGTSRTSSKVRASRSGITSPGTPVGGGPVSPAGGRVRPGEATVGSPGRGSATNRDQVGGQGGRVHVAARQDHAGPPGAYRPGQQGRH